MCQHNEDFEERFTASERRGLQRLESDIAAHPATMDELNLDEGARELCDRFDGGDANDQENWR